MSHSMSHSPTRNGKTPKCMCAGTAATRLYAIGYRIVQLTLEIKFHANFCWGS